MIQRNKYRGTEHFRKRNSSDEGRGFLKPLIRHVDLFHVKHQGRDIQEVPFYASKKRINEISSK